MVRAAAVPAIVSWQVTGATGVDLSVDGPGLFGSFGPSGSQSFNFSCGGPVGSTETHSYTLTTTGGMTVSRTLSVSAVVRDNGGGAGQAPPVGGGAGAAGGSGGSGTDNGGGGGAGSGSDTGGGSGSGAGSTGDGGGGTGSTTTN